MATPRRGPALIYISRSGQRIRVDTEAVTDSLERDLCRTLTERATNLANKADADADSKPQPRTGQYL